MQPTKSEGKKTGAVATVTILGQLEGSSKPHIMLQHRLNNKETSEFRGLWELPKGKIYAGEHLSKAAAREMNEEAGLEITRWLTPKYNDMFHPIGSFSTQVAAFQPYFCTQAQGTHNHLALAVLVELSGTPKITKEADGHCWFTMTEIIQLLQDRQVFPLDVPVLIKWIKDALKSVADKDKVIIYEEMAKTGIMPRPETHGRPAICFDLGGVLIGHKHDLLIARLASLFKITPRRLKSLLLGSGLADRLNIGEVGMYQVLQELCSKTRLSVSRSEFVSAWESGIRIREENVAVLDKVRRQYPDMQFAAATNLDVIKHDFLMHKALWYAELDYRHVSCLVCDRKPNLSFYSTLAHKLGCRPENVFFIDDKRTNIEAAKCAGLTTFTANRSQPLGEYFMHRLRHWIDERSKQ